MAREWRCAVVGTGTVGEWHVRTLANLPGCKLVAVCDVKEARLKAAVEKNGIAATHYTDALELYRREQIDAVHICTPSGDHMGPAITAMQHGKYVVVEKPMEIHLDRIDKMVEASEKYKVRLAGIFQNRWNEANLAIKQAVDAGRFGRLAWAGSFTPWHRTDQYYAEGGWRGTWAMDGGGAVMNQGVHQVDLMQWAIGPVKTVSAFSSSRIHDAIEVEDTLTCALEFANGAFGSFVSTTAMYPGSATRLEVGGEFGTAISENGLRRFQFRDVLPEDAVLLERLDPAQALTTGGGANAKDVALDLHRQNIQAIYSAWGEDKEAETNGPEARKAVAIIQAMYESARKRGAPVDVK